ncbi:MAG: cytidine deaminase [Dysgonamonadaceae bacterium]|jgi:cytidine deaminase|nr:cytidine deaminase [Dysgonamonadaceae bacterium]
MNNLNINAKIGIFSYNELNSEEKLLIDNAKEATSRSYSPYSEFSVGAAVRLSGGEIVTGSNQENVAYPSGLCAERTAIFYANSQHPGRAVEALAVAAFTKGDFTENPVSPCGACRQVILETELRYRQAVKIYLYGKSKIYVIDGIKDLLPLAFDSL